MTTLTTSALTASGTVDRHQERRIDVACARASYANMPTVAVASTVLGGLAVWSIWRRVPDGWLAAWLALLVLSTMLRFVMGRWFLSRERTDDEVMAFLPKYSGAMLSGGLMWGLLIAATGFSRDPFVIMPLLLNIGGMVAGGSANAITTPRTFGVMTLFSMGPILLHLSLSGDGSLRVIVGFTVTFLLSMVTSSAYNLRTIRESIRLRFENFELVESLRIERDRAEDARAAAERAAADKARFLATASHDVRQPLHALGLFLEVLRRETLPAAATALVARVEQASVAIKALLESLLDVSRLDAGVLQPSPRPVRLDEVFAALEVESRSRAEELGLGYRIRATPWTVQTDPDLLLRVLRNLVDNAFRYTPRGRVLVAARRRGDTVRVEVWDTGIGIADEDQGRIFEEFRQLDNPARDRAKGLGLGLSIVKGLCRLLGTEIDVRSRVGRGSVFCFTLPLSKAGAAAVTTHADAAIPAGERRLVLVVDDDDLARVALANVLEHHGFEVVVAASAEEARAYLRDMPEPFAVLSDHRLPGESGRALLEDVRRRAPEVRLALITGDTAPSVVREVYESGLVLLHKPVSGARLAAILTT